MQEKVQELLEFDQVNKIFPCEDTSLYISVFTSHVSYVRRIQTQTANSKIVPINLNSLNVLQIC